MGKSTEVSEKPINTENAGAGAAVTKDCDLSTRCELAAKPDTAELPPLEVVAAGQAEYGNADIEVAVKDLTIALDSSDADGVRRILSTLGEKNSDTVEAAYDALPERENLRDELESAFSNSYSAGDWRQAEALLNRKDGQTNVAGAIAVAIELSRNPMSGQESGGTLLRAALSTLTAEQFQTVKKQWDETYGSQYGTFDKAISEAGFSNTDVKLVQDFYSKGVDNRPAEAIEAAAKMVIDDAAKQYGYATQEQVAGTLMSVLSGTSEGAAEARRALSAEPEFMESFDRILPYNKKAADALGEGKISIATVVATDPEGVEASIAAASDADRKAFIEGRRLQGQSGLTVEQQEQVAYFEKLDKAFKTYGDDLQATVWADHMANGLGNGNETDDTLISKLRRQHDGGFLFFSDSHTTEEMISTIEKMTARDWALIHSTDGNETEYMKMLKKSIATYANDDTERETLFAMLDKKAQAESFTASTAEKRPLLEMMAANSTGEEGGRAAIADAILHMSPTDQKAYLANTDGFKDAVDKYVFPNTNDYYNNLDSRPQGQAAFFLSQSLLEQLKATGKMPEPGKFTPLQTLAKDIMQGNVNDPHVAQQRLYDIMKDATVLDRLKKISELNDTDPAKIPPQDVALANMVQALDPDPMHSQFKALIEGSETPIGAQVIYGGGRVEGTSSYTDLLSMGNTEAGRAERDQIVNAMTPAQRAIWDQVEKSKAFDNVDELRSYVLDGAMKDIQTDYKVNDFVGKLLTMPAADRAKFITEYEARYQTNLKADIEAAATREGISAEKMTLLQTLASEGFTPTLADRVRMHVLDGTYKSEDLIAEVSKLKYDERNILGKEYAKKFGQNIGNTFLSALADNPAEEVVASIALTPAEVTAREEQLALVKQAVIDEGGAAAVPDSVEAAVDKFGTAIADHAADGNSLPPDERKSLEADVVAEVEAHNPETFDATPPAKLVPSDALMQLAVVKRGEGPWQSAERILAADGKRHSVDEVRALTKAIQAVYAANRGGDANMQGLKVKHTFINADNFTQLIDAVGNEDVRALLQSMAVSPAA